MFTKKSLGQHFLRSDKALNSIIAASEIRPRDTILEIGPGEGVLTKKLLQNAKKVIAVEKDDALYDTLKEKFVSQIEAEKLELVHDDILDFTPNGAYKLVANIPYNITGEIFRKFLSANFQPELMVLLVQKEVAERIVARDGKGSILSISVKAYGEPKFIDTVKAGSFVPVPKVDSAILKISGISKKFFADFSEPEFFHLMKIGFKSKRKKLSSNLGTFYPKEAVKNAFLELGLDENIRAENLDMDVWKKLTTILTKKR